MTISVYLDPETEERLRDLAHRERRHPRAQARWLLERAIVEAAREQAERRPLESEPIPA